jgi:hypothetical protein
MRRAVTGRVGSPGSRVGLLRILQRLRGAGGQATVELVGMLPILLIVALAAGQVLAAGVGRELADHAAQAGAMAILQGGDPAQAARSALPGWARERVEVSVHDGGRVEATVHPPGLVAGHASASAGSEG